MLDLHGLTIHAAWMTFKDAVDNAYFAGKKSISVITGRGEIEKEFMEWVVNHPRTRFCDQIRPGFFRVKLKGLK